MRRMISISLILFLFFSPALAKEKKIVFDAQAAWSYIKELSSDSMMGRRSGQPSGIMGEEYIASKFKEWGIEPAGDDATYFQNFTIEHSNVEEGVVLEIVAEKERRNFYYGEDWRVMQHSGSGHFTAEIVFVGYGIHAPEKKYDDYAGVDVKGKLVLLSSDTASKLEENLEDEVKIENRVKAAQELGARGVLLFRSAPTQGRYFRVRLKKEVYKPDFVILSVEEKITGFVFKELKTELRSLVQQIERTSKPRPYETGVKAFVSVNAIFDEKRPTRNVLAKIAGSDNELKSEYVIIGAHLDHLGVNPLGDIMNGANDNASGTAVVMEVARVMKLNQVKPKRTVVFALWAGEEQGLLGSRHYADHPLYPIEKAVAYLNMDMVGQGSGTVDFPGVYYGPEIWNILKDKLPKEILDYVNPSRGGPGGSDHASFLGMGVPGFAIMTAGFREGSHLKYHQSRDEADLINPELLKKTGDLVYAAVGILASEPENLIQPSRRETYYLKYQTLVNFEMPPINHVVENHKDAKDSHVDLQMAVVEEKEGLTGDDLRVDILKEILSVSEMIKKTKGLSLYSSSSQLSRDIRMGRTSILTGLNGVNAFRDDPQWTDVLAKQGLFFVFIEAPSFLFTEEGLSEEGKKIVKALNKSGLLLVVQGLDAYQAKILLEKSTKPLVLIEKELPEKEVMELVKKKKSALGLTLSQGEDAGAYFKRLDEAKKAIGSEYLMVVNEECLWGKKGKESMLQVISKILEAKYGREDISNVFSGTFLRVLGVNRGESSSQFAFMPPF